MVDALQERKSNATYAISCAHKMGAKVFTSWEDIVQVQPKMILTFLAAAMAVHLRRDNLSKKTLLKQVAAAQPKLESKPQTAEQVHTRLRQISH